jgi:hypothetical protein
MALEIDSADRIINRTPPRDATDKSEANALNYMIIWDGLCDGKYRTRPKTYATEAALFAVTGTAGEICYVTENDSHYKWSVIQGQWIPIF